jgi:hypothetical protein
MNLMMQSIYQSRFDRNKLNILYVFEIFFRIDMNEMIERAVVQFSFISVQLDKCDQNEPTVESLKSVKKEFFSLKKYFV